MISSKGSELFVAASTWKDYDNGDSWPYEFSFEKAYVKGMEHITYYYSIMFTAGTCLSIDHEKKRIRLSFPVFDQECNQGFKYLNKHCVISLPKGTQEVYCIIFIIDKFHYCFIRWVRDNGSSLRRI